MDEYMDEGVDGTWMDECLPPCILCIENNVQHIFVG